jgi:response regulator RpfG family c-di-GMP phosphodiesterase
MPEDLTRLLCVDDELNVLSGLERMLFDAYDVTTASSGKEALQVIDEEDEPFAIIISDMRMPEMDGATFLSEARLRTPDTVRLLLTGHSDVEAAISAINDGQIFRFLCKPCPEPQLKGALSAAERQYSLVRAERQLLEDTLNGAVKALTDTLGLAAPLAFQRSVQVGQLVDHILKRLEEPEPWQFRLAAMLAPIGCITVPPTVLERAYTGQHLSTDERQMMARHPAAGRQLIEKIPRLEGVACMVAHQYGPRPTNVPEAVVRGAELLRLANEISDQLQRGVSLSDALSTARNKKVHPTAMLDALGSYSHEKMGAERVVYIGDLRTGMVLQEDVKANNDTVLIAKGREVDAILIQRLSNFLNGVGVKEPFRVCVPDESDAD